MKRIVFILATIVLTLSISFFGVVDTANAVELYNLSMPTQRPGAPYEQLKNYNTSLTTQGTNPSQYPVEVMRHHIIPDNRLQTFWNTMLERNHLVSGGNAFLQVMRNTVDQYQMTLVAQDRQQVKDLLQNILDQNYQHDPTRPRPEGFDNLAQVYEWLPGNLFIGPKGGGGQYQRTDDPGDAFERNSDLIIGTTAYNDLKNACIQIASYIGPNGQLSQARSASTNLSRTAKKTGVYPVKSSNWLFTNQKYRINTADKPNPCV